jgi:hypothetical protein
VAERVLSKYQKQKRNVTTTPHPPSDDPVRDWRFRLGIEVSGIGRAAALEKNRRRRGKSHAASWPQERAGRFFYAAANFWATIFFNSSMVQFAETLAMLAVRRFVLRADRAYKNPAGCEI